VVYLAVLGVSLLVMVIGLSALLGVRVENRGADLTVTAVKADVYAQSQVDVALNKLCNDPNWRTTYTNDTWTANQTVGDVVFSFKLVDEIDGNLADDANQPARLYAQATVGDAVRIYSVGVQPYVPPNLLSNGDMEAGTQYWSGYNCTLEARTDDVHGGAKSIYVSNRTSFASGPTQSITNVIENGTSYTFVVWVKVVGFAALIKPVIKTTATGSGTQNFDGGSSVVGTSWTKVTKTITPSWSGTLTAATATIVTTGVGTPDLRVDDAVLTEQNSGPALLITPGTWRRELAPYVAPAEFAAL
jgi:hypothetical protein